MKHSLTLFVFAPMVLVSSMALAQVNLGRFQGTDNYKNSCQITIKAAEKENQVEAVTGYAADSFLLLPSEITTKQGNVIKKGEYVAKIIKEGTSEPSAIINMKYSLRVNVAEGGAPLLFYFYDNTSDGPKFKRRQYTCTLK